MSHVVIDKWQRHMSPRLRNHNYMHLGQPKRNYVSGVAVHVASRVAEFYFFPTFLVTKKILSIFGEKKIEEKTTPLHRKQNLYLVWPYVPWHSSLLMPEGIPHWIHCNACRESLCSLLRASRHTEYQINSIIYILVNKK